MTLWNMGQSFPDDFATGDTLDVDGIGQDGTDQTIETTLSATYSEGLLEVGHNGYVPGRFEGQA